MNKSLIWAIGIVVVLLGGMTAVRLASNGETKVSGDLTAPVTEADHVKGSGDVVLVEYSDLQCPACAAYQPALKQLLEELDGEFRLVYRHFPLRQIHLNAQLAGQAAEAAGLQGKFWEMHDVLFERQSAWGGVNNPTETFKTYATELELDVEKFATDMVSDEVVKRVNRDFDSGMDARVAATPTFFLNGKKIANPRNYEELKSLIQNAGNVNEAE